MQSVSIIARTAHHEDDLLRPRRIGRILDALVFGARPARYPGIVAGARRRPAELSNITELGMSYSSQVAARPGRSGTLHRPSCAVSLAVAHGDPQAPAAGPQPTLSSSAPMANRARPDGLPLVNSEVSDWPASEAYLDLLVADAAHQADSLGPANGPVKEWFDVQDEHRES